MIWDDSEDTAPAHAVSSVLVSAGVTPRKHCNPSWRLFEASKKWGGCDRNLSKKIYPMTLGEPFGEPGMMYFPTKGAKQPQNPQNHRVGKETLKFDEENIPWIYPPPIPQDGGSGIPTPKPVFVTVILELGGRSNILPIQSPVSWQQIHSSQFQMAMFVVGSVEIKICGKGPR